MTFREINRKYIEPASQWIMIFGIIALCQPWSAFLHVWSVAIMLVGFVGFLVAIHVPPPPARPGTDEQRTAGHGGGHG